MTRVDGILRLSDRSIRDGLPRHERESNERKPGNWDLTGHRL